MKLHRSLRIPSKFILDVFENIETSGIPEGTVWVDIETYKVPVSEPDYPHKQRWAAFMISIGEMVEGHLYIRTYMGNESNLKRMVAPILEKAARIVYSATREFDRKILEGRFVNARSSFLEHPASWAIVKEGLPWENIHAEKQGWLPERGADIDSKQIPQEMYLDNEKWLKEVYLHILRDVLDNMLRDPSGFIGEDSFTRLVGVWQGYLRCPECGSWNCRKTKMGTVTCQECGTVDQTTEFDPKYQIPKYTQGMSELYSKR